jgi:hypothetical protein
LIDVIGEAIGVSVTGSPNHGLEPERPLFTFRNLLRQLALLGA